MKLLYKLIDLFLFLLSFATFFVFFALINVILLIQSFFNVNIFDLNNIFNFFKQEQKILVLLQNSDEVRSTGGFIGALAYVTIDKFKIKEINFEDVYEVAGRFNGYVEPPYGVKKYLSGGESYKLTDANWDPDFAKTSQQILWFFDQANKPKFNTVISMNESVIENLLKILGDLKLVNGEILKHDNFMQIARKDRESFFPGSLQKKHFLNSSKNAFLVKLKKMNLTKKLSLFVQIKNEIFAKNIQFYSQNKFLQFIFLKNKSSGVFINPCSEKNCNFIALVENNVAINKSNQKLKRDYQIKKKNDKFSLIVNFVNNNQTNKDYKEKIKNNPYYQSADHLHYLNYQRVFLNPNLNLQEVLINGEPIDFKLDQYQNSWGQNFNEYSFLVKVLEKSKTQVELIVSCKNCNNKKIYFKKQSGINGSIVEIDNKGENYRRDFNSDLWF